MTDYAITSPPPSPPQFDLADRLRKTLRESGINAGDMADYLGVHRSTITRWMQGAEPGIAALRLWALRCGVSYEWLTTGQS